MKKSTFVCAVAMVVLVVMSVASMTISSAESFPISLTNGTQKLYNVRVLSAEKSGSTDDDILIKIHGTKGSTDFVNVGDIGDSSSLIFQHEAGWENESFNAFDVDKITAITVKIDGNDAWYPECIQIKSNGINTIFYCAKWVTEGNEVTFSNSDNVFKLHITTCNDLFSGTDADVFAKLYDVNGNASDKINLSEIYPDTNAFEVNDVADLYVSVPDNFGRLNKIEFSLGEGDDYKLFKVTATKMSGTDTGVEYTKIVDKWIEEGQTVAVKF